MKTQIRTTRHAAITVAPAGQGLLRSLVDALRAARRRRLAIRELGRLPARLRIDVGLGDGAVESAVDDRLAGRRAESAPATRMRVVRSRPAAAPAQPETARAA